MTTICLASPLPGMDWKQSDKILLIATINEVKIFYLRKGGDNASGLGRVDLVDTKFSIATD